jgi:endonuclease III
MAESIKQKQIRALGIYEILIKKYPNPTTMLLHKNSFQFLIAVILSAQCTDDMVNRVTPKLFNRFKTIDELADADIEDVKVAIKSINYFNNKALNIKNTAQLIRKGFDYSVPNNREDLVSLPGVGRKTANVILGQVFDKPAITVDTHVRRLANRIGFSGQSDPAKVESDLMKVWPNNLWTVLSTITIFHGRNTCMARKPKCNICVINKYCLKILA